MTHPRRYGALIPCDEMRSMLAKAGAGKVQISRHYLFRMGVLLWK